jgi:DsbC/DsbD-like thiol-disulfide interchange protein
MKNLLIVLMALIFFIIGLHAQSIKPEDVVTITPITKVKNTKNGTELNIDFLLKIQKIWHINANKPNDSSLTPTEIKFDSSSLYKVISINYPPPEMVKLQFSDSELALYEQEAEINVIIEVNKNFNKKALNIEGHLQYQPCNNQTCLFPVSKSFDVKVKFR